MVKAYQTQPLRLLSPSQQFKNRMEQRTRLENILQRCLLLEHLSKCRTLVYTEYTDKDLWQGGKTEEDGVLHRCDWMTNETANT